MRRFVRERGMLVIAPVILGLGAAGLIGQGLLPNLVFAGTYQADLAALVSIVGLSSSLVIAGVFALHRWVDRRADQARAEEREAQAATRQRFLHRLDHELKNPLTIIRLGVANLQQNPNLASKKTGSLTRVAQQIGRLQKLVEDLRRLAELEEDRLERTKVNLQEILKEAMTLACSTPGCSQRIVDLNLQQVPWPLMPIWGDRDLLVVAFRNLLDNALKFTTANDQIEIRATEDGRMAVVEVADTGPGIPAKELPHIFEELYRGQNAREVGGSGLGLALVQRIVALHGGEIHVRSRLGQGTVTTVRLPLASEP